MKKSFINLSLSSLAAFCLMLTATSCGGASTTEATEEATEATEETVETVKEAVEEAATEAVEAAETVKEEVAEEAAAATTDWNALLDECEQNIAKYKELIKKAKNGDIAAVASSASLLKETKALFDKISNATSEMTEAQKARFQQLKQEWAEAIK